MATHSHQDASNPSGLSESGFARVAAWYDRRKNPVSPETDQITLRSASLGQAAQEATGLGFVSEGSRFFRRAHQLWSLERIGSGFSLVRAAGEPNQFEDDDEMPPPVASEQPDDEEPSNLVVGALVSYSLGGEQVRGKVVASLGAYVDVDLGGQVDVGVPVEMVRLAQGSGYGDPVLGPTESTVHDVDKDDKDQMGVSLHPEAAKHLTAALVTYGAVLADEVVGKAYTPPALEKIRTASRSLAVHGQQRPSSWAALSGFAGAEKAKWARDAILSGVACRTAARTLGLPLALAWEIGSDLTKIPTSVCKRLVAALKGDKEARVWAEKAEPARAKKWADAFRAYQSKRTALQKVAVDQAAEDYWTKYFGDYGSTWVREIKRRVHADLLSASLVKQGVDQSAADYWSDYFGDYGDQLVGDVDRAVKNEDDVVPSRSAARVPEKMPLPQPVQRRDIFASYGGLLLDEQLGTTRVAVAKKDGTYKVLVRVGEAQKETTFGSEPEALLAFRAAVRQHLG